MSGTCLHFGNIRFKSGIFIENEHESYLFSTIESFTMTNNDIIIVNVFDKFSLILINRKTKQQFL